MAVPRRWVLQAGLVTGLLSACGGQALKAMPTPVAAPGKTPVTGPTDSSVTDLSRNRPPAAVRDGFTPAVEVEHGRRSSTNVVLSFQGSGDARIARNMLLEAEREHVRVTVLAVGTWLLAHPFMAHRILHGGHELGNQTYSHPADLARLSPDAAYEEIARCASVLRKLTGSPGAWFRTTGSPHATSMVLAQAGRAGYSHCLSYDVETTDWTDPGAPHIVAAVDKARHGSVISLHLGHAGTLAALPAILDHLRQKGLTPVTAGDMFGLH